MTLEIGNQIGATIGRVVAVDAKEDGIGWGNFLRVNIEIDLDKTISRGQTINLKGNRLCIPLKYEKLPKLCFKCGRIIHGI